eukprot:TRINITY_DN2718_c0_g1_i1.p1 TRINITY_DN2718_c0_g1~~TRINITY_DN2718_c0_g1_i1.p1  ORF type:complete len:376 (-),score=71.47 TRINITY_DN2718_c0_g1_i1:305-1432(-)
MEPSSDVWHRPANTKELELMKELLRDALNEGAIGLSTGLFYATGMPSTAEEVSQLVAQLDGKGVYATHMRNEGSQVIDSINETIDTIKAAQLQRRDNTSDNVIHSLVISHHKCAGLDNFGRSVETLKRIEEGAQELQQLNSLKVMAFDVYPYAAGSTVIIPENVRNSKRVMITWSTPHPEMNAKYLDEIARAWNLFRNVPISSTNTGSQFDDLDLEEAARRLSPGGAIYHQMDDSDVERIISHNKAMIGSDGLPHDLHPHPRLWGTFPRVLSKYHRELGLFSLEEAIHKMTGWSAEVFGSALNHRGLIKEGYYADIVVLDPSQVADVASFDRPVQPSKGVKLVMVNGQTVFKDSDLRGDALESQTTQRPGRVLKL